MRARHITVGFALVLALMFAETAALSQTATAPAPTKAPAQAKKRPRKKAETGIPKGVHNCIDALIKMAAADPLINYEGRPSDIINNGLLWNDPKSKCSIGDNKDLRLKLLDVANAWRKKDAASVRSLLAEVKSAAPQG
ncbi:MAG: hypothetical protein AB1631_16070 [Acidobacteriota bacterium]